MKPTGQIHPRAEYVLGVDFARMGEDETVFVIIERMPGDDVLYVVYVKETKHQLLTDAIGRVVYLHNRIKAVNYEGFKKIYLDETGLGAGPTDTLKEQLGWIVEGVTFTLKSKQDMYSNLKMLMETGKLKLPNHKKLLFQLSDLRYELSSRGDMKIHHSERGHDDFADALALAAWYFRKGTKAYDFVIA